MTFKNTRWSKNCNTKKHIQYDFKSIRSQNRENETISFMDTNSKYNVK